MEAISTDRVSFRAVTSGVVVGAVMTVAAMSGAAALGHVAGVARMMPSNQAGLFALAGAASLGLGAYTAGRVASAAGRATVRRDGVLHGLVAGGLLALLALTVAAVLAAAAFRTGPLVGYSIDADVVGANAVLAALLLPLVTALAAGAGGGLAGSRAEARATGLVAVRPRRRPAATSARTYEQDFFATDTVSLDPSTRPV